MAVISGQVTTTIADAGPVSSQVQGGHVRALAVAAPQRTDDLPDVPTMKEAGADVDAVLWSGIFAPTAHAACDREKTRERIDADRTLAGCRRAPETARHHIRRQLVEEFTRILASDIARWTEVAKAGNIRMEQ